MLPCPFEPINTTMFHPATGVAEHGHFFWAAVSRRAGNRQWPYVSRFFRDTHRICATQYKRSCVCVLKKWRAWVCVTLVARPFSLRAAPMHRTQAVLRSLLRRLYPDLKAHRRARTVLEQMIGALRRAHVHTRWVDRLVVLRQAHTRLGLN